MHQNSEKGLTESKQCINTYENIIRNKEKCAEPLYHIYMVVNAGPFPQRCKRDF